MSLEQLYKRHAGTAQFGFLAVLFSVPLATGSFLVDEYNLGLVLALEVGVLIYGFVFLFLMMFVVPASGSNWALYILGAIALGGAVPFALGYMDAYEWTAGLVFAWLVFANFGRLFAINVEVTPRFRMLGETALRIIVYLVVLTISIEVCDMSPYVETWSGDKLLRMGALYFSLLAILEAFGFIQWFAGFCYFVVLGEYQKVPISKVRLRKGKMWGVSFNRMNLAHPLVFVLIGLFTFAMPIFFVWAMWSAAESWWLIAIVGGVFGPVSLIGIGILYGSLVAVYYSAKAGRSWIRLQAGELEKGHFAGSGSIPVIYPDHRRSDISVFLKVFEVTPVEGEVGIYRVRTVLEQKVEDVVVVHGITDSTFQFQHKDRVDYPALVGREIRHLELMVDERMSDQIDAIQFSWFERFPLPGV